jgi:hypothetical protein
LRAGNDGSSQKGLVSPTAQSFTYFRFRGNHNWIHLFIYLFIYLFSVICVIGLDKDDALMKINHTPISFQTWLKHHNLCHGAILQSNFAPQFPDEYMTKADIFYNFFACGTNLSCCFPLV